jgi:hypothetical protein
MALKSNAFQNALHQEYVDLAIAEKKRMTVTRPFTSLRKLN